MTVGHALHRATLLFVSAFGIATSLLIGAAFGGPMLAGAFWQIVASAWRRGKA